MWREPETNYEGRHFTVAGAQCDPKPLQQPRPPVWIGGAGEQLTLRVVARLADKANFGGKPHEWAHKRDVLHAHCRDVGRAPDEIELTWSPEVCVRDSEAELRAIDDTRRASAPWREPYESWVQGNLVGTPEQVCERIREYRALGCSYFVPWCADYPDDTSLRMVAERVMPEFR